MRNVFVSASKVNTGAFVLKSLAGHLVLWPRENVFHWI